MTLYSEVILAVYCCVVIHIIYFTIYLLYILLFASRKHNLVCLALFFNSWRYCHCVQMLQAISAKIIGYLDITNLFEVSLYVLTLLFTLDVGASYDVNELNQVDPTLVNNTLATSALYGLQQETGLREVFILNNIF